MKIKTFYFIGLLSFLCITCKKDAVIIKTAEKPVKGDTVVTIKPDTVVTPKPDTTPKPVEPINQSLILGTWHSVSKGVPDYAERYFGADNFYYEDAHNEYGPSFHFGTYGWAKNDTLVFGPIRVKVYKLTTDSLVLHSI